MELRSDQVKGLAREAGADLVGIASAAVLNEFPPDPRLPQTPERIWPECKSVISIANRIPAGIYRAKDDTCVHHVSQLVLRRQDKVAFKIARELERRRCSAVPLNAQETIWDDELGAGYGYLSARHVAVEAGLGTLGLDMNLLTPELGPRCYVTAILTDAELEPDGKMEEQVCIGESCSRCLYSCPVDAVGQWNLDRAACAAKAQQYGYLSVLWVVRRLLRSKGASRLMKALSSRLTYGVWQGMIRCVGAFGDCPRCSAVCPVGDDYFDFLQEAGLDIPETTEENVQTVRRWCAGDCSPATVPGLAEGRNRWTGEKGYAGMSRRHDGAER
jgi:ferredoxin